MKKLLMLISSPAFLATFFSTIIMCIVLLCEPIIGMADNGDFYRVANGQSLYKLDRYEEDQFLNYFSSQYGEYEYFNEYEESIPSTQIPLIKLAKFLDLLFTGEDRLFDIRFLSVLLICCNAIAIYLLVDYAAYKTNIIARYIIAALAVFIFTDVGYIAYFNSFYAEGMVFSLFLIAMASTLLLTQHRYSPYLLVGIIGICAVLLTGAKQQNAPVGVLMGILVALLGLGLGSKGARQRLNFGFTGYALIVAIILCVTGIAVYILIPKEYVNINQYHAMTRGLLMTSEDSEKTLDEFGINKQYALLNETLYYERYPAVDVDSSLLENTFYSKYGFVSISMYYLAHPAQIKYMFDIAMENAYTIRPEAIGNYERKAGKEPGAKTAFWSGYSSLKKNIVPTTAGFVIIWSAVILAFSYKNRAKMVILAMIIVIGLSQIAVSIIGAGDADLSKHIFLYNVAFDLVMYIALASFCSKVTKGLAVKMGKGK